MGTRDSHARAKATVAISPDIPDIRNRLLFHFFDQTQPSNFNIEPHFDLAGNTLSVDAAEPQATSEVPMQILVGWDANQDHYLSNQEVIVADSKQFKVVGSNAYFHATQALDALVVAGGQFSIYPIAANFLYSYLNDLGLANATSETVKLHVNAQNLTHNVGALFDASGDGDIRFNHFDALSPVSLAIADSGELANLIQDKLFQSLESKIDEITAYFHDHPSGSATYPVRLSIPTADITFAEGDLHWAVNQAQLADIVINTSISRLFIEDNYPKVELDPVYVDLVVSDLYDFDLDRSWPNSDGARVQAGYGSLGNAGHVFRWDAQTGATLILPWVLPL